METEILQKKEIKRVPKLRFGEFEDPWKEVRLGKICSTFKSGSNITSKDIEENGNYPVYGGNGQRGFANSYTHNGFYVLIGRQGALCGNINRINGKAFISEHAIVVEADSSSDTEWLAQKLDLLKLNRLSESSAQPGLAVGKLVRLKLNLPSLTEQQKISGFLSAVDKKIQQLSRKKELLETYKKGVMQQLFSQEIRFKDEDGKNFTEWEIKKLKVLCSFFSGGTPTSTNKNFYTGKIPFIGSGNINDSGVSNFITDEAFNSSSAKLIKVGDILYALYGANSGEVAISKMAGAINQAILCIRTKFNTPYLYYLLSYNKEKIIAKYLQGGQGNLSANIIKNLKYKFPSEKEQQKIAGFLSAIDKKIETVQQQITKTQGFKKGLLQQMFV